MQEPARITMKMKENEISVKLLPQKEKIALLLNRKNERDIENWLRERSLFVSQFITHLSLEICLFEGT